METWQKWLLRVSAVSVVAFIGLIGFRVLCVDFVDSYELGYKYDSRDGKTTVLKETGYFVTPPIVVKIHTIDLRPMQICINANSRVLNCKLVKFNPEGIDLFLKWHGRNNYEGPGVGSSGGQTHTTTTTTFSDILKSYAYDESGQTYPFLTIMPSTGADLPSSSTPTTRSLNRP